MIEGRGEDIVRTTENGRGRRFSVCLLESVALWLLRAWGRFHASKHSFNWYNQTIEVKKIFLLKLKRNRSGKVLQLSQLLDGRMSFASSPLVGTIAASVRSLRLLQY